MEIQTTIIRIDVAPQENSAYWLALGDYIQWERGAKEQLPPGTYTDRMVRPDRVVTRVDVQIPMAMGQITESMRSLVYGVVPKGMNATVEVSTSDVKRSDYEAQCGPVDEALILPAQ